MMARRAEQERGIDLYAVPGCRAHVAYAKADHVAIKARGSVAVGHHEQQMAEAKRAGDEPGRLQRRLERRGRKLGAVRELERRAPWIAKARQPRDAPRARVGF